jgi:hypothetical protein
VETESDMQVRMKALIGMCVCAIYGCLLISFVRAKSWDDEARSGDEHPNDWDAHATDELRLAWMTG